MYTENLGEIRGKILSREKRSVCRLSARLKARTGALLSRKVVNSRRRGSRGDERNAETFLPVTVRDAFRCSLHAPQ